MRTNTLIACIASLTVCACASSTPKLPYPAYMQIDELSDVFMATLPGVRAKRISENFGERTGRYRIDLPPEWSGTSGGVAQAALEIFVIAGELTVGDMKLIPGGYAYLPSGGLGFRLTSAQGARILYFVVPDDPTALIRAPLLSDGVNPKWESVEAGISTRELRHDPGSGARTWMVRVSPDAAHGWRRSSVTREGYLISGAMAVSECYEGKARTGTYVSGGYFVRPADTIHSGGETAASQVTTWLYRELSTGNEVMVADCPAG